MLTHIAVVRDMNVFSKTFQVPFFNGQGESYIISGVGTRVYRGQSSSNVIGEAFNVLKPLKTMEFRYGASYEELRQSVADEESCSLAFTDRDGRQYYVTSSPLGTNGWALLSVVPSDVVSAGMQRFMNLTILGMGVIALIVVAGQALERKLILEKDFTGITQHRLLGDELHLRQILINILGNAIKFTPEGGIIPFIAKDEKVEDTAALTVIIQDNGIGMSVEYQQKIFEPFSQAGDNARSRYQGTGLGMSIVRQLPDLMGGSIKLQSTLGQGSIFTVRLGLPIEHTLIQTQESESGITDLSGL